MNAGCDYELFWHMNPKKLGPFFEAKRLQVKEQVTVQDRFAWLQGVYVRRAFLSCINKNSSYPRNPIGLNRDEEYDQDAEDTSQHKMTDGQNFALFMVKHNKALKAKQQKNA